MIDLLPLDILTQICKYDTEIGLKLHCTIKKLYFHTLNINKEEWYSIYRAKRQFINLLFDETTNELDIGDKLYELAEGDLDGQVINFNRYVKFTTKTGWKIDGQLHIFHKNAVEFLKDVIYINKFDRKTGKAAEYFPLGFYGEPNFSLKDPYSTLQIVIWTSDARLFIVMKTLDHYVQYKAVSREITINYSNRQLILRNFK